MKVLYKTLSFCSLFGFLGFSIPSVAGALDALFPVGVFDQTLSNALEMCDRSTSSVTQLNLTDLSALAVCRSPEGKLALAELIKNEAGVLGSRSAYYPHVEASGYSGKIDKSVEYDEINLTERTKANTNNIQANLSWLLYDFGARGAELSIAQTLVGAAALSQKAVIQEVLAETAKRYYDLSAKLASLRVHEESEAAASANFDIANAQHKAGIGQLSNQLLFENDLARAHLDRIEAQRAADISRASLLSIVGIDLNSPIVIFFPTGDAEEKELFKFDEFQDVVRKALDDNFRIAQARAEVSAAEFNVQSSRAQGLPTISLELASSRSNALPSDQVAQKTTLFTAVVQLKIPLFDGFSQKAKVDEARANLLAKQANLEKSERDVALDAWQAFQSIVHDIERLKAARALVTSSERTATVANGRLKAGVGDMLEALRAQDDLASAKQQYVAVGQDLHLARVKLAATLGSLH